MRLVVDTSVFVAALLGPGGSSREVLRACFEGKLSPVMGTKLLAEYESLVAREELYRRSILDLREREALLNAFLSVCNWTRIYYLWRPNVPDEADNHVVELAVAGGVDAVVTKNLRDFRNMELRFPGIRILDPASLLEEVSSWEL